MASRPLSVLHVIPRFDQGGAARVVYELANGTRGAGGAVQVACGSGSWLNLLEQERIPWLHMPLDPSGSLNAVKSVVCLAQAVRERGITLIHAHHRFAALVARFGGRLAGVPVVATVHDLASGRRVVTRLAYPGPVMVFSRAVELHLIERFGLPPHRVVRTPLGMPFDSPLSPHEIAELRASYGCSPSDTVVGFVGRLAHEKGADLLLRALPNIVTRRPSARLWIIGEGEERSQLEALARTIGFTERVTFFGGREDAFKLHACFDITVVPSRREGFGLVALEALSLGKRVVATNVGGLPELLGACEGARLVPPDSTALAAKTLELLDVPWSREEVQTTASWTRSEFEVSRMVSDVQSVYRRVTDARA